MKVYNESKTQILENYDLEKGYLKMDTFTTHYNEIKEVKEVGHYETIKEYPNGGKDVKWVVEVEGVAYQPARDETEEIQVYIPYTTKELDNIKYKKEHNELISYLQETDYITYKLSEAVSKYIETGDNTDVILLRATYKEQLEKREECRKRIDELEELLDILEK